MTDLCELKRHIYGDSIDRSVINRFVDLLFPPCDCQQKHQQNQQEQKQQNSQDILKQHNMNANEIESVFAEDFDFDNTLLDKVASCDSEEEIGDIPSGNRFSLIFFFFLMLYFVKFIRNTPTSLSGEYIATYKFFPSKLIREFSFLIGQ